MVLEKRKREAAKRSWPWLVGALLIVPWLVCAGSLLALPEDVLAANLVVDDALYFAVPAQNVWQGRGLSFDGLEATNGVQALWMLVCAGIAAVVSDRDLMLRVMIAVAALCWLLAGLGVFALLRRRSLPAAAFAGIGMAWCGMHQRLAFSGMENGLSALLAVVVILVGSRVFARPLTARGACAMGLALAVFALGRTEAVLLGPICGAALVFGWLGRAPALPARLRLALIMALPGVLLVGGAMLVSRLTFGLWLPISGTVKSFYEQQWGGVDLHGGVLGSLAWHLKHVSYLALAPLRADLAPMLAGVVGSLKLWRNAVWVLLAASVAVAVWRSRGARVAASHAPALGFVQVFAAYAVVHLALMGLLLPHFTGYGTWYFSSEVIVVWVGIGVAFSSYRGRWRLVPLTLTVLLTIAGAAQSMGVSHNFSPSRLRSAGQWLEANVAKGAVVGTLSSGLVAWHAPSLHVLNLDGLISSRRYFEDFLRLGRVHDYCEELGMTWFSDYQSLATWRNGFQWHGHIPADRLVPRRYWRLGDELAYVVWQVLPRGATFELLGDDEDLPRDRYVELAVAADVHERFAVVSEEAMATAVAADPRLVVARSIVVEPAQDLLHVLVNPQQLAQIALTPSTVAPEHATDVAVVDDVRVIGFDATMARVQGRQRLAVTLYWLSATGGADAAARLVVFDAGGRPVASAVVASCHGTLPMAEWAAGQVVVETVVLDLGATAEYRLGIACDAVAEQVYMLSR